MTDPGARPTGVAGEDLLVRAVAPGRVNLIGDHTDYTGGLVLPMAVDRATTVELRRHGRVVELVSTASPRAAVVDLDVATGEAPAGPGWARYVAGVVAALRPAQGGSGVVSTTVPIGAGLSSSSALTVAVALALGFSGPARDLAVACQRAEQLGSGVPGGIMDQLCSAAAVEGTALLIDCTSLVLRPVPLPAGAEVLVAHSGTERALVGSAYAERRADCDRAAALLGPLRDASVTEAEALTDPLLVRRARHVVTENHRVLDCAAALERGDLAEAGRLMADSHRSLRDDFDVSTPELDAVVAVLEATPGVHGARLTGAGFGGCVVALADAGTLERLDATALPGPAWRVRAAGGAMVEVLE
ncbi:MAG TPA: galactokinase [Acidimicrobiales bacterium]|nr:galactokinase [Acidimicrobiales bacterium]